MTDHNLVRYNIPLPTALDRRKPQTDPVAAKMLDELLVLMGYRRNFNLVAVREALDYIARARHEHVGMVTTLGIANYLKELGKDGKEPLDITALRDSLNLPPLPKRKKK